MLLDPTTRPASLMPYAVMSSPLLLEPTAVLALVIPFVVAVPVTPVLGSPMRAAWFPVLLNPNERR